jgi:hypothetical protein
MRITIARMKPIARLMWKVVLEAHRYGDAIKIRQQTVGYRADAEEIIGAHKTIWRGRV